MFIYTWKLVRVEGVQHSEIGALDLLAKEPDFLQKVLQSDVFGDNEGESTEFWNKLKTHAQGVREVYGKPAEQLTRWQNVISRYESKLKELSGKENEQLSELVPEFDKLVSEIYKRDDT